MNLFSIASWTWFWETINSLLLVLCNWVYSLVGVIYQVFLAIARVNLFDAATFEKITKRIYIVIGIAMLFIFAYNIILMIIDPENKKTTGNTGKLVKETIISFTLIILLPTIFDWMYRFQNNLLESNIIGQIILGPVGSTNTDGPCKAGDYDCTCKFDGYKLEDYSENKWFWPKGKTSKDEKQMLEDACNEYKNLPGSVRGAYAVAPTILSAFYSPANFTLPECVNYLQKGTGIDDNDDKQICINYFYDVTASKYTGNIKPFVYDTYLKNIASDSNKTNIEFNGLMGLIAGGLAAWMFICYAMEIGVRVAKLGVLQLLSPIAVMMKVVPSKGGGENNTYKTWKDKLLDTYIDVFIRLLIIYFSLFAISLVEGVLDNLFASLGTIEGKNMVITYTIRSLSAVVVILGILKFAQEAPDLIKDFFGSSGKFALKSPRKQLSDNKYGMGAMGMVGGGVASMFNNIAKAKGAGKVTSAVGGLFGGAVRGYKYGSQSKDFDALKRGIKTSQAETEAARRKHEAIRREGQINGKEIPVVSGIWGQAKHTWGDVKKGAVDFKDFLFGNVPSAELGNAANTIMVDVDNMENDFSNATIAGIKSGRDEVMKKLNADQEFDFNGRHYRKIGNDSWQDETGTITSEGDLRSNIVESYKNRLAKAYAANESKAGIIDGFKRANESMLKDLRDAMPKLGEEFSKELFKKINGLTDANGVAMNLDVHSLDELESRMKTLMQSEAGLASIYKLNDEIKSLAKGVKISNDQALKAQAAKNDKKDK